jgi:hypothetical protein
MQNPAPQNAAPSGTTASVTPPQPPAKLHPKPVKTARSPPPAHPVPMAKTGPPIDAADLPPLDAGDLPPPAPSLPPAPAWIGPSTPTWIAPPTQNSVRRPLSLLQRPPPAASDGGTDAASPTADNAPADNVTSASSTTAGSPANGSPANGSSGDISISTLPPPNRAPTAPAAAGTQTVAAQGSSNTDKQVCRIYSATKVYQGREQPVTGLACRTPDGRWEPITEGPAP